MSLARMRPAAGSGWNWMDTLISGGSAAMLALIVLFTDRPAAWTTSGIGIACWVAIPAVYFALGRSRVQSHLPRWVCLALIISLATLSISVMPPLGFGQAIVFPYVWVMLDSTRRSLAVTLLAVLTAFFGGLMLNAASLPALTGYALTAYTINIGTGLAMTKLSQTAMERGELLAKLEAAQQHLRALSLEQGRAAERERISRELHDTLAQTLAGLAMLAERSGTSLARARREENCELSAGLDRVDAQLRQIHELSRTALSETRALIADAAPVVDAPGLEAAITRLAERYSRETGMHVDVDLTRVPGVDREDEVVLLRCAQEALANVRKHARAERASITLRAAGGGFAELEVRDSGRGFDPAATPEGFGLPGLRDRLRLAGGALAVHSHPGAGTSLLIRLPVTAPPTPQEA